MILNRRSATYLLCLIMFVFGMNLVITSSLLTDISKTFDLSMAQSGLFFSVNFAGFIIFIFIGGLLAEKYGRKRVVSFALLGLSAALLMMGLSPVKAFAFAAIFFAGGFGGVIESIASALIADLNPENTGYYLNLSQIFLCAGAVAGPLLGSASVNWGAGWRMVYYMLAIMTFLLFLVFSMNRISESPITDRFRFQKLKETVLDRKFLTICICIVLYAGAEVGAWGWMSTFLKEGMGFSVGVTAAIVSAFWVSMTLGRVICGWLNRYFRLEIIAVVLAFFSALMVMLSGVVRSQVSVFIVTVALGLAFSSQYPFLISIGSRFRSGAAAFSLMVGGGGLGIVIVPALMGVVGDNISIRAAMVSPAALFIAIGAILLLGGYVREQKNI